MDIESEIDTTEHVPKIPRLCRYLSERSPQPTVAVDGATHVVSYVNPAFLQLVGRDVNDLVGRPFADAVPEGVENGCLALLDRVYRTGIAENLAEQVKQKESAAAKEPPFTLLSFVRTPGAETVRGTFWLTR